MCFHLQNRNIGLLSHIRFRSVGHYTVWCHCGGIEIFLTVFTPKGVWVEYNIYNILHGVNVTESEQETKRKSITFYSERGRVKSQRSCQKAVVVNVNE